MATTGTRTERREPAALASDLREAESVRVVSRADGDGLAAAALLGRALAALDRPRHISMAPTAEAAATRVEADGTVLAPGFPDLGPTSTGDSAALWAFEMAREIGVDPDPGLALAGALSAGIPPQGDALEAAREAGLESRPGLAIPTEDVGEGLAFSGLLHAPFSGDETAVEEFLDDLELVAEPTDEDRTDLASAVALEVTAGPTGERAVAALGTALAPRTSPTDFATIGGYADVLRAAAWSDPGGSLPLLLGTVETDALLDRWRAYGRDLHRAVADLPADEVDTTATVDAASPRDVARLGHAYRIPADELSVAGPDTIALATATRDAAAVLREQFPEAHVSGSETVAEAWTDAAPESVFEDGEDAI